MTKKEQLYRVGDCVEVTAWEDVLYHSGFKENKSHICLILEAEYVEMDDADGLKDGHEWIYRLLFPDGRIEDAWDYEIKPVNTLSKKYNN